MNRAVGALETPVAVPAGRAPARAPVAAVAEGPAVVELQEHLQSGVMLIPAPSRVERVRDDGADVLAGDGADEIEVMDRHIDKQDVAHRFAKCAGEISGDVEVQMP